MTTNDERLIRGRDALLQRCLAVLAARDIIAVHLLGSLARDEGDALSDIDLWITVEDHHCAEFVADRTSLFGMIAPVLIRHETARNRPQGGSYSLVIHDTPDGLFQIDYYIAPRSSSVVLPEGCLLAGDDSLPRGKWRLDSEAAVTIAAEERVDFLICMAFIGVKKALRGDDAFMSFLREQYDRVAAAFFAQLPPLDETDSLSTAGMILSNLKAIATERQRAAIIAIRDRHLEPNLIG
jgi:predicted nucleotidyltransferase